MQHKFRQPFYIYKISLNDFILYKVNPKLYDKVFNDFNSKELKKQLLSDSVIDREKQIKIFSNFIKKFYDKNQKNIDFWLELENEDKLNTIQKIKNNSL